MVFLAAANNGNKIAVIILCLAVVALLIFNGFLVISLHKHNNRLAKMEEASEIKALPVPAALSEIKALPAPEEMREEQTNTDNENKCK